jgi:hypothetical protein
MPRLDRSNHPHLPLSARDSVVRDRSGIRAVTAPSRYGPALHNGQDASVDLLSSLLVTLTLRQIQRFSASARADLRVFRTTADRET